MAKANQNSAIAATDFAAIAEKKHKVIGLKESDDMPVYYGGVRYNLARLTDPEAELLIEGGYPHLVRI